MPLTVPYADPNPARSTSLNRLIKILNAGAPVPELDLPTFTAYPSGRAFSTNYPYRQGTHLHAVASALGAVLTARTLSRDTGDAPDYRHSRSIHQTLNGVLSETLNSTHYRSLVYTQSGIDPTGEDDVPNAARIIYSADPEATYTPAEYAALSDAVHVPMHPGMHATQRFAALRALEQFEAHFYHPKPLTGQHDRVHARLALVILALEPLGLHELGDRLIRSHLITDRVHGMNAILGMLQQARFDRKAKNADLITAVQDHQGILTFSHEQFSRAIAQRLRTGHPRWDKHVLSAADDLIRTAATAAEAAEDLASYSDRVTAQITDSMGLLPSDRVRDLTEQNFERTRDAVHQLAGQFRTGTFAPAWARPAAARRVA